LATTPLTLVIFDGDTGSVDEPLPQPARTNATVQDRTLAREPRNEACASPQALRLDRMGNG
jgi:hypothetical protein